MPRGAPKGFINKGLQAYKIAQKEDSDLRKKGLIEKSLFYLLVTFSLINKIIRNNLYKFTAINQKFKLFK